MANKINKKAIKKSKTKSKSKSPAKNKEKKDKKQPATVVIEKQLRKRVHKVKSTKSDNQPKQHVELVISEVKTKQIVKAAGDKTLIEIIDDTKSGIPAKSELEQKVC